MSQFCIEKRPRCPQITFKRQWYYEGKDEMLQTKYTHNHANVIIPNDIGDLNLVHGVFKVNEEITAASRIFMYLEFAHPDFDMIVDDVSVKKMSGKRDENVLHNGDFESYGKFWRSYGNPHYDIEQTSTNKALKVFNKNHPDHGVYQDLYLDRDCLEEKQRFKIQGALH